jgi:hypoxanthine phosphoribosyltransferase
MAEGKTIQIHDKHFRKYISSAKIEKAIDGIAKKINKDLKGKKPIFISVLNGSFMFASDLLKKINIECEVSFIRVVSYSGAVSTGKVNELIGLNEDIYDRMVVVLEDIIDSGNTIEKVIPELKKYNPAQVKIATMFFKPDAYKKKIKLDYVGMEIPNDFIVGYGLDYNGIGRNLSDIYRMK